MPSIRTIGAATLVACILGASAAAIRRRNPRIGTRFMNGVVDRAIVRGKFAGGRSSEIGMLEHVGRRSGVRRQTPVHPVPTADGFRIIVPLGRESRWAMNVLSAGHCRLRLHDRAYELDEPAMVPPSMVAGLGPVARRVEGALGFQYLLLRRFEASADERAGAGSPAPVVLERAVELGRVVA
jgi:deazaflavin-dependent oxidoreductase (nitroreductase family)